MERKFTDLHNLWMPIMRFYLLLIVTSLISGHVTAVRVSQRCRTTDDLGRIPWFMPNSTFHNFGFPLIRTLCEVIDPQSVSSKRLGCTKAKHIDYLYESAQTLRYSNMSSLIIVEPHAMNGPNIESSGTYVIMTMFEILYELGYHPAVRHWSDPMSGMFPERIAAAASKISHRYEAFEKGEGENPFANALNHILLQIEIPYKFETTVPVNTSPYGRTFRWIVGLHYSHNYFGYKLSDNTSHCIGANFYLGRGRMCSNSGVIPCPQYMYHRTKSMEVTRESRKITKKNIILFDNDQGEINMELLKVDVMKLGGLNDLQVLISEGRKKSDMPDFYKTVKMTIDCHNPGVEFINYESSLYDTINLACDQRATRNVFDFPVPSKYRFNPRNWTQLVNLVHDSLINYEERVEDFKHFKRLSRTSSQLAKTQVDMHYFSRDVLFRTHCASYADCRRVYPWAVAVWTLYPLAMIEVVMDIPDVNEESVDNDFIRVMLMDLFTSKHIWSVRPIPGVAPVDMFPSAPCAYMVYMDASFIPFGRDFLNTHVAALVKDPRPIVYWFGDNSNKLAIAVMHARPCIKLFKDAAGGKAIFAEINMVIHTIGDYDTYLDLLKVCDGPQTVSASYFKQLRFGASFYQSHLTEILTKHPPLPSEPCQPTETSADRDHHRHDQTHLIFPHHCAPPANLIIDAVYVPKPLVDDNNNNNQSDEESRTQEPRLWLTSSAAPVSASDVFSVFTKKQVETIVQHMDPILQNANFLKILPFIPEYIAEALAPFSAAHYPDVISLRDMEYPHWGKKCG